MSQNPLLNPNCVEQYYVQIIDNAPNEQVRQEKLKEFEAKLGTLGWSKDALLKLFNKALFQTKWYKWQRGKKLGAGIDKKPGKSPNGVGTVGYSVPYGTLSNPQEIERQKRLNWTEQDFEYYDKFTN